MSKGHDKHQHRMSELSALGKDLARRSHSCCELCAASGVSLAPYEVEPIPTDPDIDKIIFICEVCRTQIEKPKLMDANHWRCLNTSVWSEVPAVQVMAVRVLKRLMKENDWASDLLEQLFLEPEISEWIDLAE